MLAAAPGQAAEEEEAAVPLSLLKNIEAYEMYGIPLYVLKPPDKDFVRLNAVNLRILQR